MNKAALIAKMAEKCGLTQKQSEMALNAFTESVMDAMKNGDKIQLSGFGTFEVRERTARIARNPATGENVEVPAKKVPAFRPGKAMKERIK